MPYLSPGPAPPGPPLLPFPSRGPRRPLPCILQRHPSQLPAGVKHPCPPTAASPSSFLLQNPLCGPGRPQLSFCPSPPSSCPSSAKRPRLLPPAASSSPAIPATTPQPHFSVPSLCGSTSFALPTSSRTIDVHPSILFQIDALSSSLRGVRVDVDLFAPSLERNFCAPYVWQPFDDLASLTCLLFHDPHHMPGVVACAAAHRALALFIVPVLPAAGPYIIPRAKTKAKAKAPEPWFDYLLRHSLLSFKIPRAAFRGPGGSNFAPHHGMMAVSPSSVPTAK